MLRFNWNLSGSCSCILNCRLPSQIWCGLCNKEQRFDVGILFNWRHLPSWISHSCSRRQWRQNAIVSFSSDVLIYTYLQLFCILYCKRVSLAQTKVTTLVRAQIHIPRRAFAFHTKLLVFNNSSLVSYCFNISYFILAQYFKSCFLCKFLPVWFCSSGRQVYKVRLPGNWAHVTPFYSMSKYPLLAWRHSIINNIKTILVQINSSCDFCFVNTPLNNQI